jgi:hypothetical protein
VAITSGKFHGVMSAHTPNGLAERDVEPGILDRHVSPKILLAAPPQYSRVRRRSDLVPRVADRLADVPGLDLRESSEPLPDQDRGRSSTRPRSVADVLGHGPPRSAGRDVDRAAGVLGPASATSAIAAPFPAR